MCLPLWDSRAWHERLLGFEEKVQNLIKVKEIEFDALETPNVITAPMPKHGLGINFIDVVSAIEDTDSDYDADSWIFPTTNGRPSNWTTKDFVPINFIQK